LQEGGSTLQSCKFLYSLDPVPVHIVDHPLHARPLCSGRAPRGSGSSASVAAPEGLRFVEQRHPSVGIYTPVVDVALNDQKYIVPGLGDFGDRLYGTL